MVTEIEIKNYLKNKYDVTIKQIIEELNINSKNIEKLKLIIKKLIVKKWIVESKCLDGEIEYDPGEKLNYGGLRG